MKKSQNVYNNLETLIQVTKIILWKKESDLLKEAGTAKFNETVEAHVSLKY